MRGLFAALLIALPAMPAPAQQEPCRHFSWSLGRQLDLFSEGSLPTFESAQALPRDGFFSLRLTRSADVIYPVTPERASDSSYGGFVTIERMPAGRYRILVSADAWVDAIEQHARLPVLAISRVTNCPGALLSVEFEGTGEPLTIQVTGARAAKLDIAVVRVWNFEGR